MDKKSYILASPALAIILCVLLFTMVIGSTSSSSISSGLEVTLLDKTFVRGTAQPITERVFFPSQSGEVTVFLTNGDAQDATIEKVGHSSRIVLDANILFDESNFNQNVNSLDKSVSVGTGTHILSVLLKSKPGGQIRIRIVQRIDADAVGIIGQGGGIVRTPLGSTIEIPPGALSNESVVSIKEISQSSLPLPLSSSVQFIGGIDIKPDGQIFSTPATIRIIPNTPLPPSTRVPIAVYDPGTQAYVFDSRGIFNETGEIVSQISHTSIHFVTMSNAADQERRKAAVIEKIKSILFHPKNCFEKKENNIIRRC